MQKGELFNSRYRDVLAAIKATPGISHAQLAEAFGLSYNIIRALTVAMEKEGDITGRVERTGLRAKIAWRVNAYKTCMHTPEGRVSIATRTPTAPQATHAVRVHVVEKEAQPATYSVRVHVTEEFSSPTKYHYKTR